MKIDGVFSGGGIKAYAFIGSLKSIYKHNLEFERVAGTSAGAIIACLLASGYTLEEIEETVDNLDLSLFLDAPMINKVIPGMKWISLYFQLGLYKGRKFESWLTEKLANKGVYTFDDLPQGQFKVVVSDLTLGKLVVIPDDLERIYGLKPQYFSVAKAVRMSASFPYFFMPERIPSKAKNKSVIVDGGLLSNFPLWIFENSTSKNARPILGVKLSESVEKTRPHQITNALDMLHALFSTMKQAHDARYISKSNENNIIFIPVKNIAATDFSLDQEEKENLIEVGWESTQRFLKYWPN